MNGLLHLVLNGHGLDHAGIDAVEFGYLSGHVARLFVDTVYCSDLRTGTLELHFIDAADAGQRAVEILQLGGITGYMLVETFWNLWRMPLWNVDITRNRDKSRRRNATRRGILSDSRRRRRSGARQ